MQPRSPVSSYSFSDYKKLSPDTRSLVTRYWAEVVKESLGARCPNQILKMHLTPEETAEPDWASNKTRFWSNKLKGQPVTREIKVDQTECIVPGTKSIFTNPLWHLIGTTDHDISTITRALTSVGPQLHPRLFRVNQAGHTIRKPRIAPETKRLLFASNSLNSLACTFALTLEAKMLGNRSDSSDLERILLKLLLRLSTVTELSAIQEPLYNAISASLNRTAKDLERLESSFMDCGLPHFFYPNDVIEGKRLVSCYLDILQKAIRAGLVKDARKEKLFFLYTLNHTGFYEVWNDIDLLAEGRITEENLKPLTLATIDRFKRTKYARPIKTG